MRIPAPLLAVAALIRPESCPRRAAAMTSPEVQTREEKLVRTARRIEDIPGAEAVAEAAEHGNLDALTHERFLSGDSAPTPATTATSEESGGAVDDEKIPPSNDEDREVEYIDGTSGGSVEAPVEEIYEVPKATTPLEQTETWKGEAAGGVKWKADLMGTWLMETLRERRNQLVPALNCSCTPAVYRFRVDLLADCESSNVAVGGGVDQFSCNINPGNIDQPPVRISSYTILELDESFNTIAQITENDVDLRQNDTFEYTSISNGGVVVPKALKVFMTGQNAVDEEIVHTWIVLFTGLCNDVVFSSGCRIGWSIVDGLAPPRADLCDAVTEQPSPAPSGAPSNTPSDTPSQAPSDAPSHTPSDTPSTSQAPSGAPSHIPSNSQIPSGAPSHTPSNTPSTSQAPSGAPGSVSGKRNKALTGSKAPKSPTKRAKAPESSTNSKTKSYSKSTKAPKSSAKSIKIPHIDNKSAEETINTKIQAASYNPSVSQELSGAPSHNPTVSQAAPSHNPTVS